MPPSGPREIPSREAILSVSQLDVLDENGRAVTFGSLFEKQKIIAVFIRAGPSTAVSPLFLRVFFTGHFWCAVRVIHYILLFDLSRSYLTDVPGESISTPHCVGFAHALATTALRDAARIDSQKGARCFQRTAGCHWVRKLGCNSVLQR